MFADRMRELLGVSLGGVPKSGLMLEYKIEDISNGNLVDTSGNGYTSTYLWNAIATAGAIGNAMKNASIDGHYARHDTFLTPNKGTISGWWKPGSETSDGDEDVLFTGGGYVSAGHARYGLCEAFDSVNNRYNVYSKQYFSDQLIGYNIPEEFGHFPNDGKFHSVIYTWDNSIPEAKVYIDNTLVITKAITIAIDYDGLYVGAHGGYHYGDAPMYYLASRSYGKPYRGTIDQFRVYNRVLSDDERLALYRENPNGVSYPFTKSVLYDKGNVETAVTGGWQQGYMTANANTSLQPTSIQCQTTAGAAYYATMETVNKINTRGFKKLRTRVTLTAGSGSSFRVTLSLLAAHGAQPTTGAVTSASTSETVTGTYNNLALEIDLTAYQGDYYVAVSGNQNNVTANFYEVWLEN